jgi:hypothetical protein
MTQSADAAEQIVRLSLEGAEVTLRLAGSGAKEIGKLLLAVLSEQSKTKGKSRLASMLNSGKELKVFSVKESDMKKFASEAKRYGVLYCAIKNGKTSPDGLVDVMVRAEDAAKIDRIVERFKFATVDTATVKHDIEQSRATKGQQAPAKTVQEKSVADKTIDDILAKPTQKDTPDAKNPTAAKTDKPPPSKPTSKTHATQSRGATEGKAPVAKQTASKAEQDKPSVKKQIDDKRQERKAAGESQTQEPSRSDKSKSGRNTTATKQSNTKTAKTKKSKTKGR